MKHTNDACNKIIDTSKVEIELNGLLTTYWLL